MIGRSDRKFALFNEWNCYLKKRLFCQILSMDAFSGFHCIWLKILFEGEFCIILLFPFLMNISAVVDIRTTWVTFQSKFKNKNNYSKNISSIFSKKSFSFISENETSWIQKIKKIPLLYFFWKKHFLSFGKCNFLALRLTKIFYFLKKGFSYVSGNGTFSEKTFKELFELEKLK